MADTVVPDKRERILKAAVKLFSENGFHATKVEQIAEKADVGKGTVYEYFKSKEEIFIEMFKGGSSFYMQKISNEVSAAKSAQEKLFKIIEIHCRFIRNHRDLARVIMQEHSEAGKFLHQWAHEKRMQQLKLLQEVIVEGIANGEFETKNPMVAASLVFGMIASSGGMYIFSPEAPPIEEIVATIEEFLFKGIIKK